MEKLNLTKLKALAKENGLKRYSSGKKADLVAKLIAAGVKPPPEEPKTPKPKKKLIIKPKTAEKQPKKQEKTESKGEVIDAEITLPSKFKFSEKFLKNGVERYEKAPKNVFDFLIDEDSYTIFELKDMGDYTAEFKTELRRLKKEGMETVIYKVGGSSTSDRIPVDTFIKTDEGTDWTATRRY